ncbi:MAG: prepilin peptidase [Proteobacteria bacterium]|nr:prepilin peptidase [Pseudomonadota bacterium]
MGGALEIGVWCLLIAASITDILWGKVFNGLTLPFLALGCLFSYFGWGLNQLGLSLLAAGTAFLVLFPLYFAKIMAAGDVKLLMAAGAWLNPKSVMELAALAVVFGAVVGLIVMMVRKGIKGTTQSLARHLTDQPNKESTRIPFAPAFLCAFSVLKIAELRGWSLY